jgi:hypothetical protein
MRKSQIKLRLSSAIIFFLAYFFILSNSWAQAADPVQPSAQAAIQPMTKAEIIQPTTDAEVKSDAPPINNDQKQPAKQDLTTPGGFITNLIASHLTNESLLSKSAINPDALDNNASTIQEATTKIINNLPSSDGKNKKITSLMYDPDELSGIQSAIDSLKNDRVYVPAGESDDAKSKNDNKVGNIRSYIYLGSILYFGPKNWAVWIDGKKITYEDNKSSNELYLTSVTSSSVDVLWKMSISKWKILSNKKNEDSIPKANSSNQIEINFTLKSNQTYSLRSGNVTEGFQIPAAARQNKDDASNNAATSTTNPTASPNASDIGSKLLNSLTSNVK